MELVELIDITLLGVSIIIVGYKVRNHAKDIKEALSLIKGNTTAINAAIERVNQIRAESEKILLNTLQKVDPCDITKGDIIDIHNHSYIEVVNPDISNYKYKFYKAVMSDCVDELSYKDVPVVGITFNAEYECYVIHVFVNGKVIRFLRKGLQVTKKNGGN